MAFVSLTLLVTGLLLDSNGSGVCSGFRVASGESSLLYTAAHCVDDGREKLWMSSFEGDSSNLYKSKIGSVLRINDGWRTHRWKDLSYKDIGRVYGDELVIGDMPMVGDRLIIAGYPSGVGPVSYECIYQGVAILGNGGDDVKVRPSIKCLDREMSKSLRGASGGPVLNSSGKVVGVLTSGSRDAAGYYRPSFEPIRDWIRNGKNSFPVALGWDSKDQWVDVWWLNGKVEKYEVRTHNGVIWSRWDDKK